VHEHHLGWLAGWAWSPRSGARRRHVWPPVLTRAAACWPVEAVPDLPTAWPLLAPVLQPPPHCHVAGCHACRWPPAWPAVGHWPPLATITQCYCYHCGTVLCCCCSPRRLTHVCWLPTALRRRLALMALWLHMPRSPAAYARACFLATLPHGERASAIFGPVYRLPPR